MSRKVEKLANEYKRLVETRGAKMSEVDIARAARLLDAMVACEPSLYGVLSSYVQSAPKELSVDEAFVWAMSRNYVQELIRVEKLAA